MSIFLIQAEEDESMAYATYADIEARWRPLTEVERTRATVLLEDAAVRIDAACPTSDPATANELAIRKIVSVEMVKRVMQAPVAGGDGAVTSVQQGAGPYQETVQYANPMGNLYLSKDDRRLLGCGNQRAFTATMFKPREPNYYPGCVVDVDGESSSA